MNRRHPRSLLWAASALGLLVSCGQSPAPEKPEPASPSGKAPESQRMQASASVATKSVASQSALAKIDFSMRETWATCREGGFRLIIRNPGPPLRVRSNHISIRGPNSQLGIGRGGWDGVVPSGTRVVRVRLRWGFRDVRLEEPEFVLRMADEKGERREIKSGLIKRRPRWNCNQEAPASAVPIVKKDAISLAGKWSVTIVTEEGPNDAMASQYSHQVRITPEGTLLPILRRESKGKVQWVESPKALGWIRQLNAHSMGMKWKEYPDDYAIQSKSPNSFVLTRTWVLPGPTEEELVNAPEPQPPRGDRSFDETLTFRRVK